MPGQTSGSQKDIFYLAPPGQTPGAPGLVSAGAEDKQCAGRKRPSVVPLQCAKTLEGHHWVDSDTRPASNILVSPFTDDEVGPETKLPRITCPASGRIGFKTQCGGLLSELLHCDAEWPQIKKRRLKTSGKYRTQEPNMRRIRRGAWVALSVSGQHWLRS